LVSQTSGTLTAVSDAIAYFTSGNGGYGAYTLSAGSLQSTFGGIRVGYNGASSLGNVTQTGGTITIGRYYAIGAGGTGVVTLTGGTTTVNSFSGQTIGDTLIGDGANTNATLNIGTESPGAGTFTTAGVTLVDGGNTAAYSSALNLNAGGTLNLTAFGISQMNTGSGTVNLNGGVIGSSVNNLTLLNNTPSSVNVYNGGAVFNVSGSAIADTVSANMLVTTGSGLLPAGGSSSSSAVGFFNVSSGGAGYIASPIVTVSGGGGTGATAIANVSNGVITGVTLTNPGQGYTPGSTVTFSFNGGGATTAAPAFTYTIAASGDPNLVTNGTGGLTKIGTGTLLLTGQSTYTGTTAINAGELNVGSAENAGSSGPLGNGGVISFNGGSLQYSAANQHDYSGRFSTAANQAYSIDTNNQSVTFNTPLVSTGGSLAKLGLGTLTLNAGSTYTGATNVNAGTLLLSSASSLGNTAVTVANGATLSTNPGSAGISIGTGTASVTVNSGGTLYMMQGTSGVQGNLNIVGTSGNYALTLGTLATAANLNFDLGSSGPDVIAVTGNVNVVTSGSITINPLANATVTPGTYPLITAGSFNNPTFSLTSSSIQVGSTAYAFSLSNTGTVEQLSVQQVVGTLAVAYWTGNGSNLWGATNGSGALNFSQDSAGQNPTPTPPDATTNVIFSASSATSSSNLNTMLSGNQTINSLTFNGQPGGATISISGYALTIDGFAINNNTNGNGINIASGSGPVVINSNVVLGGGQTWTDSSSSPFVVNGSLSGASSLALTGSGAVTFNGSIGGLSTLTLQSGTGPVVINGSVNGPTGIIVQSGAGSLTLAGSNTFTGGVTIAGGTLNLNNPGALGAGPLAISGALLLDNTSGSPVTISSSNVQTWNGNITFNGTNDLNIGTGPITLGAAQVLTVTNGNFSTGGTITDNNAGYTLTTAGAGNLNLNGAINGKISLAVTGSGKVNFGGSNSYTGSTVISNGTLTYSGSASSSGNGTLDVGNSSGVAILNIATAGTLNFNSSFTIGEAGQAAVTQSSGTVNALGTVLNYLAVGNGGYGSYVLSGSSSALNVGTGSGGSSGLRIGGGNSASLGVFSQTGGTLVATRYFSIGTNGLGVATFTGGTTTVQGYRTLVGDSGAAIGVINLGTEMGGTELFTTPGLQLAQSSGGGTLDLNSGTLAFSGSGIYRSTGSGVVNLNGGIIQANATSTLIDGSFNNSQNTVNVYNGGANFNISPGVTSTIVSSLLGASGNGIYKNAAFVATPNGGTPTGYIGAPIVTVSGGSGSGAQAIANIDTNPADATYGQITGFTMTNPGYNYQPGDTLNLSLQGGSSTNSTASYTYTLAGSDLVANSTGGLNETGGGTLVLNGSNTYQGATNVAGGTLTLNTTASILSTAVTISNGATLNALSGSIMPTNTDLVDNGTVNFKNATQSLDTLNGSGFATLNGTTVVVTNGGTFSGTISDFATSPGSVNVAGGTLTLSGTNSYSGVTTVAAGAILNVTGTGTIASALTTTGTVNFGASNISGSALARTMKTLTINQGGIVNIAPASPQTTRTVLTVTGLSIAGSTGNWLGSLDLADNDMVVKAGGAAGLARITNEINEGFNGGTWQGPGGIVSTTAAANPAHLTTLGVILNDNGFNTSTPLITSFDGTSVADGDVLVKYTYYGDANLDGVVDGSDYSRIDNGFLNHLTGWVNGDFNYDGVVDGSDYTLIDNAFNSQGASLASEIASPSAIATAELAAGAGSSSVPEPASLGLLGIGAVGLLGRRAGRRRN
jgi:fibronectin-binding autotransporter adhesin